MKMPLTYFFLFFVIRGVAQQTIAYTQYTFNKAGVNPASSGTEINQKYYYAFGFRRQWTDFDNSPKQNFINVSYTLRPPRSYRYWQNFSFYADNDDVGLMDNVGVYGGYSLHILFRKKMVLSFGVFGGVRKYTRSVAAFDANDPVVQKNRASVILYPDLIPGVRISNAKFFAGASVRQLTITKLQDFKGRKIGGPSRLTPTIYAEYGKKISLGERLLFMPSVAANIPLIGLPSADATMMFYYSNRIGGGVSLRNISFASAILQVRFLENATAGFAYSYPLNATRYGSGHSYELMIGVVPMGMDTRLEGKHSVARCPSLNY
jgi:type IX secretion system PorP/SprF family membrane protein